jgi:hypothetical protein
MKKLSVRLSLLCMLAVLLIPFAGCKKEDTVEETPAMSTDTAMETTTTEPMMTDTMGTDTMGTDTIGTDTMGTDAPPAGQ